MIVSFSKKSINFLELLSEKHKEHVRQKLKLLVTTIENEGIIPFKKLVIKNLKGKWKKFMRMRIGKIRVIFKLDRQNNTLFVYEIDFRGNAYKKKSK